MHGSCRSHAAGVPSRPYYLNIKPIGLARHARQCSLLPVIAAMLGTDTVSTRHPAAPLWFNSHYQCPTHVGLSPTLPVAHWPQQGTKHTNPLWSQNTSRTIAWHLLPLLLVCLILHSELIRGTIYSIYPVLNVGWIYGVALFNNLAGTTLQCARKVNIHITFIQHTHTRQIIPDAIPKGVLHYIRLYILMRSTPRTMDRAALHNPFTRSLSFLLHIREGV